MKIGKKEINLLIGLLGVAIAVVVWMFVASPLKEKTAALQAENAELKEKANEYESVNAQREAFLAESVELQAERAELLENFKPGISKEDEIMYWANMERANASTMALSNLVMSSWTEVHVDGEPTGDEEGATQLHLYKAPVNYTYQATYDGLKNMVNYVFAQQDKKSIESLNASFDSSTGNLVGSIDINMFYMTGTGNEYVPSTIPTVPTGVSDIFHSTNTLTDANSVVSNFEGEDESVEKTE